MTTKILLILIIVAIMLIAAIYLACSGVSLIENRIDRLEEAISLGRRDAGKIDTRDGSAGQGRDKGVIPRTHQINFWLLFEKQVHGNESPTRRPCRALISAPGACLE